MRGRLRARLAAIVEDTKSDDESLSRTREPAHPLLALQDAAGNRAVQRLVHGDHDPVQRDADDHDEEKDDDGEAPLASADITELENVLEILDDDDADQVDVGEGKHIKIEEDN